MDGAEHRQMRLLQGFWGVWGGVLRMRKDENVSEFPRALEAERLRRVQANCMHYFVPTSFAPIGAPPYYGPAGNTTAHIGSVKCVHCSLVRHDTLPSLPSPAA